MVGMGWVYAKPYDLGIKAGNKPVGIPKGAILGFVTQGSKFPGIEKFLICEFDFQYSYSIRI